MKNLPVTPNISVKRKRHENLDMLIDRYKKEQEWETKTFSSKDKKKRHKRNQN